jgi:hypothetical protein
MALGLKTANIKLKKQRSHLNSVVIGHRHPETAKIIDGRDGRERESPKIQK